MKNIIKLVLYLCKVGLDTFEFGLHFLYLLVAICFQAHKPCKDVERTNKQHKKKNQNAWILAEKIPIVVALHNEFHYGLKGSY